MNNSQGALYFGAGIDMNEWRKNITEMRRDILGLSQNTAQQTKQMDTSFRMIGAGLATYFSGAALGNFANQIINVRGEFQKTEIAFGTMLKSTEKAKALMGQMVELAAKTPFSLQDVSQGAKQLLAFQVPAEEVVETLTRMGNIAAGLGVPLGRINLVYGQVMAKGKLAGDDLRQFTEAGIPMLAELAKKFGTSTAEISKMVSAGKIGFKDVKEVLFSLTNEGGMFFNLMELQSKSLSGQMANLGDAWDQMLNSIGEANEGILGDAIQEAIYLIENYKGVIDVVEGLVLTYGAYRAAIIVNTVALRVAAMQEAGLTIAQIARTGATKAATAATALLNATMLANPFVLVTTLLAGLVVVLSRMNSQATYAAELQQKYNDKINEGSAGVQAHKAKVESFITAIKSENTTNEQRKTLLGQLNTLTNGRLGQLTIEEIRTGKATAAIDKYVNALDREARAKAVVDLKAENYRRRLELQSQTAPTFGAKAATIVDANTYKDKSGNTTAASVWNALTEKSIDSYNRNKDLEIKAIDAKDKEYDAFIRKNGADLIDTKTNIGTATAASNAELGKAAIKNAQEVEKIYGTDTLKGLQQRISQFNEIMETSAFGGEKYNSAKGQKEALEARLKAMTSSFEDEITETKRQIEVRDKLLKSGYDKSTVDAMFPQVKDQSFLQYLEKLGTELEKQHGKDAAENVIKLQSVLEEYKGSETFIDNVNKQIENLKSKFSGNELIDKLEAFKKASLEGTTGDETNAKRQAVEKAQAEELERQKANYEAFLKEKETFEQKKAAIDTKYDQIDASINGSNNTADEKARLLSESGKARGKEYSTAFLDGLKNTEMWQRAFGDIAEMTNRQIKEAISSLKIKLKEATAAEEIKTIQDRIKELQDVLNNNPFEKIANSFKILRDESATTAEKLKAAQDMFNGLGEGVNMIGDAFGGFGDAADDAIGNIMDIGNAAFELGKSIASGDVAGMIMAGIKLIGSIGKALNGDQKKERQIKKQAAALKELENAYNALGVAAEKALGAQKYTANLDMIKNLEQQKIAIEGMIRKEDKKKGTDNGKINDWKQQITGINQTIDELKENIVSDVLQTSIKDMASQMGDALVEAFGRGEDGVDAINGAFDNLVKNILKNQLNKVLEGQMQGVYKNLLKASGFNPDGTGSFDGLTDAELADIRAQYQLVSKNGEGLAAAIAAITGATESVAQGMKGDIKGITEKTAGAMEGQMNAIRMYQVEAINIHKANQQTFIASLQNLVQIEFNTRRLHSIDDGIQTLISKSKGLAGL